MPNPSSTPLPRNAWIEVDLDQLRRNFAIIRAFTPAAVRILAVVKAGAYGHGSVPVARVALAGGACALAVITPGEAATLRDAGIRAPIFLLTNPSPADFPWCRALDLVCCVGQLETARLLDDFARREGWQPAVHLKINTGMNRFGLRWSEVAAWLPEVRSLTGLRLEGVYSHFAMSDELDKTFAHEQQRRFQTVLEAMAVAGRVSGVRHLCNSGGLLDLPEAHYDLVRVGILSLGVYPSKVCRRLPGLAPVMTVKARITALQELEPGDTVGYGRRYTATSRRRVAVLPLGYADGFPRVRNEGCALVGGRRVPLVGGVAMDALAVDVTDAPGVKLYDEAVIVGRQGAEEIPVEEVATLARSVTYDVLAGWRDRLPRLYTGTAAAETGTLL
ncbi:MAG: alanine racemase [Verrucomicrobiota bacterium]|jgi:alanine racemase